MKVRVESVSPIKKKISIVVPEERVVEEFDLAYKRLGNKAQVPGFRKGKVPRNILEKMFAGSVSSEVYENLVRATMVSALEENKLDAVAMPTITEPKHEKGEGFSFTASVEIKPQFEPKDYKGVELKKPSTEPKEAQIQDVLKKLQDGHAVLKDREGATQPVKGDFVALLIQKNDSKEEPKEQVYEIGEDFLKSEVGKEVLKLGINDSVSVKEFPARVTLKAIKEKILPSVNDEFAKSIGPFENLAKLKEQIVQDLTKELEETGRAEMIEELLKAIMKSNPVELPESLVDQEVHQMIHGFWSQMERAGIKEIPEEYSEEKLHEKMHPDAERRVHEQLLIEAIANKEGLSVSDEEVTERMVGLAKVAKVPFAEFRAMYEKTQRTLTLRFHMLAQKTLDFLLSAANIK